MTNMFVIVGCSNGVVEEVEATVSKDKAEELKAQMTEEFDAEDNDFADVTLWEVPIQIPTPAFMK